MAGQVLHSQQGTVACITLSHPGKLGAMSRAMWTQLRDLFIRLHKDQDVHCVLLRGEEGAFCAGGDISEYPSFRFDEAALRRFHEEEVWGGLQAILDCDVPVLAQIEGACMGAGMEIASCCDIRIAGESARFGAPIARLGFPMAPREARLVARAAGELTAREMLLEAAALPAAEMKARGFLNRVVPDADVADKALARAERIAGLAPQAARLNKQVLRGLLEENQAPGRIQPSLDAIKEVANPYRYAASDEHREGIAAFLAKRPPVFRTP